MSINHKTMKQQKPQETAARFLRFSYCLEAGTAASEFGSADKVDATV